MFETLSSRALIAAAILAFVAGCSGNSTSLASGQSSSTHSLNPRRPRNACPARARARRGPLIVPMVPLQPNAPRGWPAKKHKAFFSSRTRQAACSCTIRRRPTCRLKVPSPPAWMAPDGVAVDKKGDLYVANAGNSTVTVYPLRVPARRV